MNNYYYFLHINLYYPSCLINKKEIRSIIEKKSFISTFLL